MNRLDDKSTAAMQWGTLCLKCKEFGWNLSIVTKVDTPAVQIVLPCGTIVTEYISSFDEAFSFVRGFYQGVSAVKGLPESFEDIVL